MRISSFVLIASALVAGCKGSDKTPPAVQAPLSVESGTKPVAAATSAPAGKSKVALAKSPDLNLIDSQVLLHVYRDGLVIPFASEGFRKYVQEYAQPWGPLIDSEQDGRVLTKRSASLYFPWQGGGAATLRLWMMGAAPGQRVEVRVNNSAQTKSVPEGWSLVEVALADGVLKDGENRLGFLVSKVGTVSGQKAYGVFGAVEIVPAGTAPNPAPPAPLASASALQLGSGIKPALMSPGKLELWVEIPERAHLDVELGAVKPNTAFAIRARTQKGVTPLLDFTASSAGWTPRTISLAPLAGQLVALEFVAPIGAAWGNGRIAVEAAKSVARPAPYKNAVLVVVDAMRSDRLTLYGKTRVETPRMTTLAKERGVVFLHNQAASPSSPPSHGSIQTGMIPRVHGVVGDTGKIGADIPTISTQLGDAGIATGYYGNNPFGMGRLKTPGKWTEFHQPTQEGKGSGCDTLMKMMLDFADQQHKAGKRFFISSLPYEPHTPYLYWEGITDKFYKGAWNPPIGKVVDGDVLDKLNTKKLTLSDDEWKRMLALYDGEVEKMDQCFGQLIDGLQKMGVLDDTLVVLTSDHGEGMYEHENMGHAWGHNAELANVPLVLYGKGLAARSVDAVTNHINIVPTILDLLGVKISDKVQGQSLVPLIERDAPWMPRVVSLEYGRSYSLRAHDWRYIVGYNGEESLYDVKNDPGEKKNLVKENGFGLRYMRDLTGLFLAYRAAWREPTFGTYNNHKPGFTESL